MWVRRKILAAESPCIAKIFPQLTQVRTVSILAGYGNTDVWHRPGVISGFWSNPESQEGSSWQYKDNEMLLWWEYKLIKSCFLKVVETLNVSSMSVYHWRRFRLLNQFSSVFLKNLTMPSSQRDFTGNLKYSESNFYIIFNAALSFAPQLRVCFSWPCLE